MHQVKEPDRHLHLFGTFNLHSAFC
uniref:Uncharacterized protein n=1 Tax=Arundo donax TaxID=35708 RepID=A0A0A8ZCQ3_ARUDO